MLFYWEDMMIQKAHSNVIRARFLINYSNVIVVEENTANDIPVISISHFTEEALEYSLTLWAFRANDVFCFLPCSDTFNEHFEVYEQI